MAVALDTALDDELRLEGVAREVVRSLNDLRKARGFEIADRIRVVAFAGGTARDALERHRDWIMGEVLADEFAVKDADGRQRRTRVTRDRGRGRAGLD